MSVGDGRTSLRLDVSRSFCESGNDSRGCRVNFHLRWSTSLDSWMNNSIWRDQTLIDPDGFWTHDLWNKKNWNRDLAQKSEYTLLQMTFTSESTHSILTCLSLFSRCVQYHSWQFYGQEWRSQIVQNFIFTFGHSRLSRDAQNHVFEFQSEWRTNSIRRKKSMKITRGTISNLSIFLTSDSTTTLERVAIILKKVV